MNDVTQPKIDWKKVNAPILHQGTAITLPAEPGKMPLAVAAEAIAKKMKEDDQKFHTYEKFDAFPHDAAVAVVRAMTELFGWPAAESRPSFFGPQPPSFLNVRLSLDPADVIQVPMGQFKLPGIDDSVQTGIDRGQYYIGGEIKKKDSHHIVAIATLARKILKEESIYRGKPIKLLVDDNGDLIWTAAPEFMDVRDISESDLIFDAEVTEQINTNLLVPIKETQLCRHHKIPLKRGVLLEGKYGTGKSLTAKMVARTAELNGWTFVLLDKIQGLKPALEFAVKYAPAVVFAEDIDRVLSERNDAANDLINTIDGVVNKNVEVMTVLTTNHIEKIEPVMLRPGRLDAVISLKTPKSDACQRLVRHYAGKLLASDQNLKEVGAALESSEFIPAAIRECVERAKLSMIGRRGDHLIASDVLIAVNTMKTHMALLQPQKAELSHAEKLGEALRHVVGNGTHERIEYIHERVDDIYNHVS
jgi:SpoVK/Ycf46/Vps4 family AAA+-type ATPase